jgi:hypothetical protein
MGHLILQGDSTTHYPGFSLLGESTLAITFDDALIDSVLDFLVLKGTTSVSIASNGFSGGFHVLHQLEEKDNVLTTVTVSGPEDFNIGSQANSNLGDGVVTDIAATAASPTKIHSSLTLIDASATTGHVDIFAGAANTSGAGPFDNGASLNPNITITYTGLKINGGSGTDIIENDAKNGIVTVGNGDADHVFLGGAGAKATLGTGTGDVVAVGISTLGSNEAAGAALGDRVTFGQAATAVLFVGTGAEAGPTAGTASIGQTKVLNAADGMKIDFQAITTSNIIIKPPIFIVGQPLPSITTVENAAVGGLGGPGVAFFNFKGNEYFIATNHNETVVSSDDAIVKLVGVQDLNHSTNAAGLVTLHV